VTFANVTHWLVKYINNYRNLLKLDVNDAVVMLQADIVMLCVSSRVS